jgi:hypothetical protein
VKINQQAEKMSIDLKINNDMINCLNSDIQYLHNDKNILIVDLNYKNKLNSMLKDKKVKDVKSTTKHK